MKFEIDPNELTTDQRAHVAAFITGWPTYSAVANRLKEILAAPETEEFKMAKRAGGIAGARNLSEEQRLDAEQKADLREGDTTGELREISGSDGAYELGAAAAANLNAIFGSPPVHCPSRVDYNPNATIPVVPLDKEGLPWDARIHASTKTFIADGSWKLRRGVDPDEVATVKAQLKELMAVPTFVSIDDYTPTDVVQALGVPLPPAPVVITPIPPAPKSIDQQPVTLTDLIGRMSKAISENRLTQANITEICVKHGVSEFHLLSNRPDLLPLIDADMKAMGV